MAIIQGNAKQGSTRGFYPKIINGSLRFNDDDSARLQWTPSGTATDRKKVTLSVWVKLANILTTGTIINARSAAPWCVLAFSTGDGVGPSGSLQFAVTAGSSPGVYTSRVFRDPSAWYHVVVSVDTTQATASNRVKIWINGEQETLISGNYPTLNQEIQLNSNILHEIGNPSAYSNASDFYLANFYNIDGQALTPSDFGETKNGVWVAKDYAGTFGTNGFYLTFEDDTQVEAFNTVLYRGNNSNQTITGVGFSPDLVWAKNRVDAGYHHDLYDTVRGNNLRLYSSQTNAEGTGYLQFDNSDGFSLTSGGGINNNGSAHVAWCWDAGANNAVTGHSSVTYTGNGGTQKISGLPFTPDLVWIKNRDNADNHYLYDSVRGPFKGLNSDTTSAEVDSSNDLSTFDTNGFIVGSDGGLNRSGQKIVAWAWDAGDSDPVSNTTGDTTATVKTNGDFSIMAYSGTGAATSIGHGLSSAPNFVIVKDRTGIQNWVVWTDDINTNGNQYLELNQTSAIQSSSVFWNSTAPDASKIYLGTSNSISGRNFICYAWRNVTGKQKFGSYTGTGSTGLTVTTGFRPGFLMIKRDGFSHWEIHDGSRDPFANPSTKLLNANQSNVEDDNANGSFEFTDTGFIVQTSHEERNFNGDTYIYAAFAGSYSDYITDYNTDGSIDSRVKASQTYGFSICSFNSGASGTRSFGHGLGTTPSLCIFKERNSGGAGDHWVVWEGMTGNPATSYGYLNLTNAFGTDTSQWSNTAPTSTEFTFNSGYAWSINQDMIAYCWAEKTGYSKFGSYTGNGSSSGPSVTTNFNPACLIVKRTDTTGNWFIWDNTRDTDGVFNTNIHPNLSNAEAASGSNFVTPSSTGFQLTGTGAETNASGGTYIYAAFADTREAAFWLDQSTNDNDWQPVNLDHNDTVSDSPTNNFATLNPLNKYSGTTLSDGNLTVSHGSSGNGWCTTGVTHGLPRSGKFYVEFTIGAITGSDYIGIGISEQGRDFVTQSGDTARFDWGRVYFGHQGIVGPNNTSVQGTSVAPTYTTGDVISVAWDGDTGKVWWAKNGVWTNSGNPSTGANPAYSGLTTKDYVLTCEGYNGAKATFNAGQQPFKYDPPA